ncbi:MAG TPA: general stress protein [Bacillus sp. (in: firmicutes)]|nr:general stress protein [Bacillus sp. (in: firmicutes)]
MNTNEKHIVGVYDTEAEAIRAVEDLKEKGYRAEDISVIGKNRRDIEAIADETGTKAGEGAAAGAATGGAIGGLAGLLAGVGALAIPGIGPILAAGPIAATLTGAAVGAGTGGLAGALIGMGIPEDEADRYDSYVKEGKILVLVDRDRNNVNFDRETLTDDLTSTRRSTLTHEGETLGTDGRPVFSPSRDGRF